MAKRFACAVWIVLLGITQGHAQGPKPNPVPGKIRWVYDFEEGKRLAQQSGKPLFVVIRCER
jgi:hypothetical protein